MQHLWKAGASKYASAQVCEVSCSYSLSEHTQSEKYETNGSCNACQYALPSVCVSVRTRKRKGLAVIYFCGFV
jgi:hypothetical protein